MDDFMDDDANWTNGSLELEIPHPDLLDYAEITLLSCLVIVGGPLNIICFCRSSGQCSRAAPAAGSRHLPASRNSSWRVNNVNFTRSLSLRLHLTAANLFIIWFYGISQICWLSTYSWVAGDFMCRLVKFFHTFCFYLTSNIIVTIALDRVYVTGRVDRPARSPARFHEQRFCFPICWVPWIVAFVASAPQLFVWNVIAPYGRLPDWHQCVNVWLTWKVQHMDRVEELRDQFDLVSQQELIYSLAHLLLVFWCPAFIIMCSYAFIISRFRNKITKTRLDTRRLQRSTNIERFRARALKLHYRLGGSTSTIRASAGIFEHSRSDSCFAGRLTEVPIVITTPQIFANALSDPSHNVAIQTLSRVKRRTVRASACIAIAYVISWSPYNILEMWRFTDSALDNRYLELLSNLIVLNAVLNPLIYDTRLTFR